MIYTYYVPIIVRAYGDEEEDVLPTKKSICDFVMQHLMLSPWRDFFPEESDVENITIEGRKDRLKVHIFDSEPYSAITDDIHRGELQTWCDFGYFDSGKNIPGRYYGYNQDEIVVYLSDDKLPITSQTKTPKMESA